MRTPRHQLGYRRRRRRWRLQQDRLDVFRRLYRQLVIRSVCSDGLVDAVFCIFAQPTANSIPIVVFGQLLKCNHRIGLQKVKFVGYPSTGEPGTGLCVFKQAEFFQGVIEIIHIA